MVRSMFCAGTPSPTESAPCGSRSISRTRRPYSTRLAPRLMVEVVLPTPPFWLHIAMTFAGPCTFLGFGSGIGRGGRPVSPGPAGAGGSAPLPSSFMRCGPTVGGRATQGHGEHPGKFNGADDLARADPRATSQPIAPGHPLRLAAMSLKRRLPFLRSSFWRLAIGMPTFVRTGQIGDGREEACAAYVEANARRGDVDGVLAAIDTFATEKSMLVNVGDEKGALLDAAIRRVDPRRVLELGTYCGYSALRIARAAPQAQVYSVELSRGNAEVARSIWAHVGVDDRIVCVVGTIGDGGQTLDALSREHGFRAGSVDLLFIDHEKSAYLSD